MALLPSKVTLSANVLFQQIANECVLLNLENEQYFGLDDVGARIWEVLMEESDTEKALSTLLDEYNIDEATLRQDLADLIAKLEDEKLLVVEN